SSKLNEAMYAALQQGFQSDKAAKLKSSQVDLPKGVGGETRKRKEDEEEPVVKKEPVKTESPVETPAPVAEPEPEIVAPEPAPQPEVQPEPEAEAPATAPQPEPEAELPAVEEQPAAEQKEPETEHKVVKIDAPEIEGPRILDKIDLSALEKSTRPKKTVTPAVAEEKSVEKKETPVQEQKKEEVAPPAPVSPAAEEPEITKIKAERIEGPKILGKIDLPVDNDTRPKRDEKRKRKRIPIEKKEVKPDPAAKKPFQQGGNRDQRGPAGGGFRGGDRRHNGHPRAERQIEEKAIQDKIRETQAKLSGGGNKQKSMRAEARRDKRNEVENAMNVEAGD